ncbi:MULTISPECIES: hypothetical protein [unclassified Streptomyces]|uniref:hypothetical protein n=1 Tax=unclassified Streptomyces TaxID=2593676 RepID=UPI00166131D7|nr:MULTISPECIES: hypothetical protein [unclassified Streptomyces]MBD0707968.1 hypothetical protein [Streptomyces sp. CBMA291]MBD0715938.1 hypothetical protein [Streptomyces sp. CBMA370]
MQPQPEVGDLVRDTATGRVGFYVGSVAGRLLLRAVHGGLRWEAEPSDVQAATPLRELRARAAEINARSRREAGGLG